MNGKEVQSYVYREFGLKNRQGNFSSLNMHNKIVRQHQNTTNPVATNVLEGLTVDDIFDD